MTRLRKIVLFSLGGIVIVLAGLALFLKLYLTDEKLRAIAEPLLEEQLGRDVSIGKLEVNLLRAFPDISVGITGLAIHTPDRNGQPSPDLASVDRIWVDVPLMPLLQSKVHVKSLLVDAPTVLVEVYDDLSTNLIEIGKGDTTVTDPVDASTSEPALQELALEDIKIREGRLGYLHADGTMFTVEGLNTDLYARMANTMLIDGQISIDDVFFETGGIAYANHWAVALDVDCRSAHG